MNAAVEAVTNAITTTTLPISTPIKHPFSQNGNPRSVINSQRPPSIYFSVAVKTVSLSLLDEIPPNALRKKQDSSFRSGFSLGVDLGFSRTGLAISKGFVIRPLTEVDEFIIGLPLSIDGRETTQSNKVHSVAGRLAVRAAERGWRVYLEDEHATSTEALNRDSATRGELMPMQLWCAVYSIIPILFSTFDWMVFLVELISSLRV